jgi:hypothetical protein
MFSCLDGTDYGTAGEKAMLKKFGESLFAGTITK